MPNVDQCRWNGDCDNCTASDCIASWREALRFYAKEEAESKQKYGRESVRQAEQQQRKNEYFWIREAKWI